MAEAALAVLVVGIMMVAALNMVTVSAKARGVNASLGKGPALAHGLMSEVLQAFYDDPDEDPVLVEGPEVVLSSYDPSSPNAKDFDVNDDKYVGQVFQPTLPTDAVSWSVTKVMFQAKYEGNTDGIASIQLRPIDSANKPSGAIIEQVPMPESSLSSGHTWQTFNYSSATGLLPDDGLSFVVAVQLNDSKVCAVLYDDDNGDGYVETNNGGAHWQGWSIGMPHYVYGKVTTNVGGADYIGTETGEGTSTRSDFDDVDDYHSWSASPPQSKDGTDLPDYDGWTRSVTVEWVNVNSPGGTAANSETGAKRITVTVTDPRGAETTIVSVRSNTGTYEQEVMARRTYCSWVGLDMQIGEANAALSLGASLANEPVVTSGGG